MASSLLELGFRLLRGLSLHLGLEKDFFDARHKGIWTKKNTSRIRAAYYPSLAGRTGVIRCGEHADYGTITLLLQDHIGGLEVRGTGVEEKLTNS